MLELAIKNGKAQKVAMMNYFTKLMKDVGFGFSESKLEK